MQKGFLYYSHPFAKLIFSGFISFSVFILILFIGSLLSKPLFNISIFDIPLIFENFHDPENLSIIKYFQVIQTIGLFVIPPFLIGYFINRNSIDYLNLNISTTIPVFIISALVMLASLPMINFLAEINSKLKLPEFLSSIEIWMKEKENMAQDLTLIFVKAETLSVFLFNLFMIAIIPAIGEELLFRGVIQKICIEWTKYIFWGIFLASLLFSTLHFQFYGFLPRLLLGLLLGYLYYWSKSIWLPIFAHFINNGAAVFAYYRFGDEYVSENLDKIGTVNDSFIFFIISVLIVGFLLYFLKKQLLLKNNTKLDY